MHGSGRGCPLIKESPNPSGQCLPQLVVTDMRLTLRTLLAHLDDILDPADREELTKKIESSEFANDLIHRTRDTMRRLRLSAPQPLGTGMALDPNTVAEYLDNVLPPDAVGDFERICLESDVHLAEVASCHHVLTMVLGEPAAVDADTKQRMYAIATEILQRQRLRVEPAHISPSGDAAASTNETLTPLAATDVPGSAAGPAAVEIPDYLRTSGLAKFRGLLLFAAAVLLVCATAFFALGLTGWFSSEPQLVATGNTAGSMPTAEDSALPETAHADQTSPMDAQAGPPDESSGQMASTDQSDGGTMASPADSAPPRLLTPGINSPPTESSPPSEASTDATLSTESATPLASDSPYFVPPETDTPDRYGESTTPEATPTDESPPAFRLQSTPMTEEQPASASQPPEASTDAPTDMQPPDVPTDGSLRIASAPAGIPASAEPAGGAGIGVAAVAAPPAADSKLGTYLGGKNVLLQLRR